MSKLTLLDMVQDILNDIDSDEVNGIDDTVESSQVAQIVKTTYFTMMSTRNWPHLRKPIQMTPSHDVTMPTHMYIQDNVKELDFINYDTRKLGETRVKFTTMQWRDPEEFIQIVNAYNNEEENVDVVVDTSGLRLQVMNDRAPTVYTSFDDRALIFNSYDKEVESTLQATNTQSMAYIMPTWSPEDSFVPDLPEEAFMALLEEAKSRASRKLRQVVDAKSEQEANKQHRWLSRKARRVNSEIHYPDYGRRGRGSYTRPYIDKNNTTPGG